MTGNCPSATNGIPEWNAVVSGLTRAYEGVSGRCEDD